MRTPLLNRIPVIVTISILHSPMLSADEFEDFKAAQQNEFNQYRQSIETDFANYKKALQEAFDRYRGKVEPIWGKTNAVPDQHRWVEYGQDLNERSIIDFKKGVVRNEIILTDKNQASDERQRQRLQSLMAFSLTAAADRRSMIDISKTPARSRTLADSEQALLSDMVTNQQGERLNQDNIGDFVKNQSLHHVGIEERILEGGITRTVLYNEVAMVPDHIDRRAFAYKNWVEEEASRQKLTPQLVFAIIETESSFNPNARSPIPAFGLMQLVPTSGARDAHRFLFKKDAIVTDSYLYKPDNNIELGAAYLHLLYHRYLKGIKNHESRLWAAIAAYNTGTANIWKTFGVKGDRKMTALQKINRMTPEAVYEFLYSHLPHKETRQYVKKIRNRMQKYAAL